MKKIHIFLFLFLFIGLSNFLQVQASTIEEVKERWYDTRYYPLNPGHEEWQKHDMFTTLDILNPPYDLLFGMSTQELANLMQEHPLMSQITTYYGEDGKQDYATFYAFMETNSDIFYELLSREDGFSCILEAYRNHEIDVELLNKTEYASEEEADKALAMWWQEIYGCQFIRHYAPHFTESEYEKACEIMEEKKGRYAGLNDANLYYLNLSDIEPGKSQEVIGVRANYLSESQIQEKEARFTAPHLQIEELEKEEEQDSNTVEKSVTLVEQSENVAEDIILGVVCLLSIGFGVIASAKDKKNE